MGLLRARMTCGKVTDQIIESIPLSCALSEFCDDAQSEWVAADSGQMLTQKVGGSAEVAGGRGADHIDVVAFPVHLSAAHWIRGCFGEGAEIGDGELESGIGPNCLPECRYRVKRVDGLLRLAIEVGGLDVCGHRPTVVLDSGTGKVRLATAGGWLFWILRHGYHARPLA
jgi:hypothetical protein